MPDQQKKFYLTTPIYYVNARPHIGHAYTTIAADVLARRHRLLGEDVFFLTGTDEHGQKIERSAASAGIPPQQFADEVAASFEALWKRMGITNDKFIRTTSPEHKRGVQKLWRELEQRGAIYLDSYTGAYCVSDETFVDLPAGTPCPDCGRPLEIVTEENYFFKLSDYQQRLIDLIESGTLSVEPESRRNEVLSFVRGGLKDLSISRTSFKWGIPVPTREPATQSSGAPSMPESHPGMGGKEPGPQSEHVIYVWLDALTNYMTAVGYGSDALEDVAKFEKYWPADLHLVGKEIIRFHCVYWPAFLLAAGLPLPKKIQAHGWLLFEESKMSKSRGNIVRTETILDAFGEHYRKELMRLGQPEPDKRDCDLFAADVLRYFLLREIPFGQDGSFSFDALITRYNADLVNGFGNLVSRTLTLAASHFRTDADLPSPPWLCEEWQPQPNETKSTSVSEALRGTASVIDGIRKFIGVDFDFYMRQNHFHLALTEISSGISIVDGYLSWHKPWVLAKSAATDDRRKLVEVLYTAAESIRIITGLLYPVMPHTTAKVWAQLGLGDIEAAARNGELKELKWGGLTPGTKLGALAPIFPRAPKELAQVMSDMEAQNNPPKVAESAPIQPVAPSADGDPKYGDSSATPQNDKSSEVSPTITIDDFAKVDLRVAKVLVAERIPKADKLLRLEVDLGYEKRQILAGIAQFYEPEKLVGRKVVIVANLAPRKMRGLESQGMVVAASVGPDGAPVLAGFLEDVEIGARLK
jgi:methionyl-tRNA synthetase